jgi:hypothetical protein
MARHLTGPSKPQLQSENLQLNQQNQLHQHQHPL